MINKITESSKNKRLFIGIGIIIVAIIGVYAYFKYDELYPSTDDAYVGSSLVNVAPKVNGYLTEIHIKNDQAVHKGELLFTINPIDYQISYEQADKNYKSQLDMTQVAKQQISVQKGQIDKDNQQMKFLQQRAQRYTTLYKANTISQQDYQNAITDFSNMKSQLNMDNDKYQQFVHGYQYSIAKQEAAKAQLDMAKSNLNYTKYYSPVDGYITNMNSLTSGEFVNASQQLFGIVDSKSWWVDANFKETQLERLKIGQKVSVTLDMYDHKYNGTIQSISYASGNTFSLLPAQNATGNWVKVTQRFAVRIKIENDKQFPLRVGSSAKVTINTL
ncbi:MAG: HlyD family secretion protein [Proteobacteria bacterium]|jgi:membrane fusion protein (multidrug efflux system)|nr:HlyD family secretion protein [Pseudomonadota bacterium]